jgi:hypothetical protein
MLMAYLLLGIGLVTSTAHQIEEPQNRPTAYYSYSLRCIGQSLEGTDLKSLEVKTQGDKFIVQGWSKKASSTMDIVKRYTPDDIRKLDAEGRKHRRAGSRPTNLLSLSQVLRFCGSYVDRLGGRLTRVSWQDQTDKIQSISIEFEPADTNGNYHRSVTTVEELCIHIYKQRKKISAPMEKARNRSPIVPTAFEGL